MKSIDSDPYRASILAVIIFGLVLVPVSFGLRLWARWISSVNFWWDDLLMFLALIGALGVVVDNVVGLHYGEGKHVKDLSDESVEKYGQTVFAFFFLQTITVALIKASLLFLYWRTFPVKRFRRAVYAVGAVIFANAIESIFGFLFQCTPVEKFWKPMLLGHCIDQRIFITLASAFYMTTDLAIYTMPMPIIWHLQMTTRRRVGISIVFLLGGFVCLTGIVRIIYTIRLDLKDITYTNATPSIWNMVESQVGFVAANVPSLGPLLSKVSSSAKRLRHTYNSQSLEHGSHGSTRHTITRRGSISGFERIEDDDGVGVESTAQPGSLTASDNDLTESIPMGGIVVKTNLEQN